MMKTRQELETEGTYLNGDIVPEWFKKKCDSCSIKTRTARWLMRAKQAHAPCVLHDWDYFCIALAYANENVRKEHERLSADFRLKQNRAAVAKRRWIGRVYGALYFNGVRIGGEKHVNKTVGELLLLAPDNYENVVDLHNRIKLRFPDHDMAWLDPIYAKMIDQAYHGRGHE